MNTKLSLESERWKSLKSVSGESAELPGLIRGIQVADDANRGPLLADLESRIFEQYSCCEATYAVVPYLVETARFPRRAIDLK